LPAVLVQLVEGMLELLLRALLARQELHVVHHQHADVTKPLPEPVHLIALEGADHLVDEGLGRQALDPAPATAAAGPADRRQQVRLAETDTAPQEERVEAGPGLADDGPGRIVGDLVAGTDDERLERAPRRRLCRLVEPYGRHGASGSSPAGRWLVEGRIDDQP